MILSSTIDEIRNKADILQIVDVLYVKRGIKAFQWNPRVTGEALFPLLHALRCEQPLLLLLGNALEVVCQVCSPLD